jgi:hypothetical protein
MVTGRISHLHWTLSSNDGSNTVKTHGSVKLLYAMNDPVEIPFAGVTVEIARNWLQERLSTGENSKLIERHVELLAEKATPTTNIAAIS